VLKGHGGADRFAMNADYPVVAGAPDRPVDDGAEVVAAFEVEWLSPVLEEPPEPLFFSQGIYRYDGLPLGTVSFRVSAAGYAPKEASADTSDVERLKITLSRE